ncbi:UDP-D-galactose (glucosyl)lipopolysaccharide-1,6-D-galactosyltransferase [Ligilactobacillus agilis DSM 20509]|uniref:UDP-D-galactose (Glucosyl)lipopolysaccharide-1,6-D-galactosyltransferase n=1 Tax=Ligilactobacillus agilis DSM 20509 TaxID=1423718 RepID=A0A0R2AL37_9LACO|nr:glycosyltransferase [Ligilactobacillus agilis]KRM63772.1 UDP-D-galactose (glucosyl)lipopolysaccharide-1,6-D-galactosyltransferase [Ligilactobacillus agilis DSM 20509]
MKKLNFLCSELSGTGGTETVLVKVLNHLINKYDITLTLSNEPEKSEWLERLNSKVKVLTFKGNNNLAKLVFISKIFLFSSNTDFISLSPKMILIGNKLRKLFKKKYRIISWFHYSLTDQDMFDTEHTLPYADSHFAISRVIRQQLLDLGIPKENISLIYNPIEEADIIPRPVETPNKDVHLFYAGRVILDGQKNLREMFTGISDMANVYLDVYGTSDEIKECQKFAKQLNISDRVIFHGWTPDLWKKIKVRPTALIMTSKYEGLSMVMLEAIAHGIPVITSRFKGYDDIVQEGINGFSYSLGDIQALTESINKIAEANLDARSVKDSISCYYPEKYFEHLDESLEQFLNYTN